MQYSKLFILQSLVGLILLAGSYCLVNMYYPEISQHNYFRAYLGLLLLYIILKNYSVYRELQK